MAQTKQDILHSPIRHIDIKDAAMDARPIVQAMGVMSFQAGNLHRAASIYDAMQREESGAGILGLAGSLVSAGLKQIFVDLIRHNMVDALVSTRANLVEQDFFEGLGFKHYLGSPLVADQALRDELTTTLPLLASHAFHEGAWRQRTPRHYCALFA